MYKSVLVNKITYDIIREMARSERRTIVATIDLIVENEIKRQNNQ